MLDHQKKAPQFGDWSFVESYLPRLNLGQALGATSKKRQVRYTYILAETQLHFKID